MMKLISISVLMLAIAVPAAHAQRAPESGYIFPAGGKAGTTVEVHLGGYNWTPDLEYFVSDPRVRLVPSGPPGPLLIAEPPYWFGAKGRITSPPIPREASAKLIISPEVPPGPIYWQVANANGASNTIAFMVASEADILEVESTPVQRIANLPATVSGRLLRNEEVDRYMLAVSKDGPITCELEARRLGSKFLGILEVRDARNRIIADVLGTHGADPVLTFAGKADTAYTVSVRDVDFAGDRSYVYRLSITPGPRIVAAHPAAGKRGEARDVEFLIASGASKSTAVKRSVTFPKEGARFPYRLETPHGVTTPFPLFSSEHAQSIASADMRAKPFATPGGVTGVLDQPDGEHCYLCEWKKGDVWSLALRARALGSPLDVSVAINGPPDKDGKRKELARNEDLTGTVDAGLAFSVPADGVYEIVVSDTLGKSGSAAATYWLDVQRPEPDFTLRIANPKLHVPVGGKTDLVVKAMRQGGFKGPIALTLKGLPDGVNVPADLTIAADKTELAIGLNANDDAGAAARLVTLEGTAKIGDIAMKRIALAAATPHLLTRDPDENLMSSFLVATTMKQRFKGKPVDQDTGRKVPRGSTHAAEVIIERLDGFDGEITLQMAAQQSYAHQGITGGEVIVPPGVGKTHYPCFMPEWLESTRTSRMGMIAVAKVSDPKGKPRYLVSDISGFVTMTMEGALLKVSVDDAERQMPPDVPFDVQVKLARLTKLAEPVHVELIAPKELSGRLKAEPLTAAVGQDIVTLRISPVPSLEGRIPCTIRATSLQDGKYLVRSEAPLLLDFNPAVSSRRDSTEIPR